MALMSRNYIYKINKIYCAKVDYVKKNLLVQDVKVTPGHIGSSKSEERVNWNKFLCVTSQRDVQLSLGCGVS
jgi:hypothetical protein